MDVHAAVEEVARWCARRTAAGDPAAIEVDCHGMVCITIGESAPPWHVRRKLGFLLLDFLRVTSFGARLPWSDWARRYAGIVGRAGASHVLFSPETLNPQHATFLNVSFGSSYDADDTHVGAMLHPGVAVWSAALATAEHVGASGSLPVGTPRARSTPPRRTPRPPSRATNPARRAHEPTRRPPRK